MSETLIYKAHKERREITAPVLVPEVVDAHGEIYSEEEVLKACRNFNAVCMKTNLQHMYQMEDDAAKFIESYVTPADMNVEGVIIKKGSWVATMKVKNDSLWQAVKEGEFTGFSIGCMAQTEYLKDE
jgi:hypothetical protein